MNSSAHSLLPVVILISGRGSNLAAIIKAVEQDNLPINILAVISNRPDAAGLDSARRANITTAVIDHTAYPDRQSFDQALQTCIDRYQPEWVVLAGFMRILTTDFVEHYRGRLINIHPSLLPDLPGLNTHQRALDAGYTEHGASIHFVTADMDGGPVFLQARVDVYPDDNAERLGARVLEQEHRLYPMALRWITEDRIALDDDGNVRLDGEYLQQPAQLATTRSTIQT